MIACIDKGCDRKTAGATARNAADGRLRSANPLIPKDATASDRTDRKKRGSFYSVGGRAARSALQAPGAGFGEGT
jgi:hypothetical protein